PPRREAMRPCSRSTRPASKGGPRAERASLPAALKRSFAPVVDEGTRVLLLGSLPGEQSLALGQYYGNPRNQFWKLMEAVTGAALEVLPYPARLDALLREGVGLWDVVDTASRAGSLDAAIRN